jgi:predicted ester cyclase
MAKKSSKQIATEYFGAVGARDVDAMITFWKPGGRGYIHGVVELRAPDTYHRWFSDLFRAFPDFKFEILDVAAYGDKAAVRWRARGTFNGDKKFEGLAPTGAQIDMEGCDMLTIEDGLITENRAYMNSMEMARQLGALPPAGSLPEKAMFGALNAKTAGVAAIRKRRERR